MESEHPFRLPDKGWTPANFRYLETFLNGRRDSVRLRNRREFPPERHFDDGSIIVVKRRSYILEGGEWRPLVRGEGTDSYTIPWSFQGDSEAATLYEDFHYLPLTEDSTITKVKVRVYPALGAGETLEWQLMVNGVEKTTLELGAGDTVAKARLGLRVDEDDEVNVQFTHSDAIAGLQIQAHIGVERA